MMVDPHPDVVLNTGNPNLQRNKSERNRLQGLMRITSNASTSAEGRVGNPARGRKSGTCG